MDVQATLYDLLDAIDDGDREAVDTLLDALKEWNKKEGLLPTVEKQVYCDDCGSIGDGLIVYRSN